MGELTSFLFATPSFLEGMGSIFDFGDSLTEVNESPSGELADTIAIASDNLAVGCDLYRSLGREAHLLSPHSRQLLCGNE